VVASAIVHRVHPDRLQFRRLPGRQSADPLEGVDVGELSVRFARLTPGPRSPHRHPSCVEVIHVLEGTGTAWQDGETTAVGPGDVYVVPVGVAHATLPDPGNEMLVICAFPVGDLAANTEELEGPIEL
jgi:quercetin dioxygenase-like cupin family protein